MKYKFLGVFTSFINLISYSIFTFEPSAFIIISKQPSQPGAIYPFAISDSVLVIVLLKEIFEFTVLDILSLKFQDAISVTPPFLLAIWVLKTK